jgi:hypothetical protein
LVITLFSVGLVLQSAQARVHAQAGANAEIAAKMRAKTAKIGVGENAKVEVKLRDQTRIRGYISEMDHDSLTVVERDTGARRKMAYEDVAEVKRPAGGLSTKGWIVIGAAAAGAIVTWSIVKPALCDGGAQSRGIC